MIAAFRRKQKRRVAMRLPKRAKDTDGGSGRRDVTIFCAFPTMHMDRHSLPIDVTDLQGGRFADSQAECVSSPDESCLTKRPAGVDHLKNLRLGDHFRQPAGVVALGLREDVPVLSRAGDAIEELDGAEDDALRSGSGFAVNDLMQQVLPDLVFGDFMRRFVMKVSEFADFTDIAVDGAFAFSIEANVLGKCVDPSSFEERGRLW